MSDSHRTVTDFLINASCYHHISLEEILLQPARGPFSSQSNVPLEAVWPCHLCHLVGMPLQESLLVRVLCCVCLAAKFPWQMVFLCSCLIKERECHFLKGNR